MRLPNCCATDLELLNIIDACMARIVDLGYKGYDPADLLNTRLSFVKGLPGVAKRLLTLANFYSPINLRKFLSIEPAQNTTAMFLWGFVNLRLFGLAQEDRYRSEVDVAVDWLLERALVFDNTIGWSRVIDYQSRASVIHDTNTTLTFINANAANFFFDLNKAFRDQRHLETADAICGHLLRKTNRIEKPSGVCLSYTNNGRHEVLNASILAGQVLNRAYTFTSNREYQELSEHLLQYILNRQNEDGSWHYSYDAQDKPKKQIDFHQCYLLDGIQGYKTIEDDRIRERRDRAFENGTRFYIEKMFDRRMRPLWRYPIKYPIDIHNVAHGVFFLSRHLSRFPEYAPKLEMLVNYMLSNLYNGREHRFYYQQYPFLTVKHDFFRWNTMWSLLALSELLTLLNGADNAQ